MSNTKAGQLLAKMEASIDAEIGLRLPATWTTQEGGNHSMRYVYRPVSQPVEGPQFIFVVPDGSGRYSYGPSIDGERYKIMLADSLQELRDGVNNLIANFPKDLVADDSNSSDGQPDLPGPGTGDSLVMSSKDDN